MTEAAEEVERGEGTVSLLGQEHRETTVSGEWVPAQIQRATTMHRVNNIAEKATGAGICPREAL